MPAASVYTMQATLNLVDIPLSYSAPIGPSMDYRLNYNHQEQGQPANFTFANVGQDWCLNWISYVTVETNRNATVMIRDGGSEFYPFLEPNNVTNPYPPELRSQAILSVSSASSYIRSLPDGSYEVFDQPDGTGRYFMTQVVDAQGNKTLIQYDSNFRITLITDAIAQASTPSYVSNTIGNPDYYRVSQISDPFSRTTQLSYDAGTGSVGSITDAVGLRSDFTYDSSSSFINLMTTPYGSTSFRTYIKGDFPDSMQGLRTQLPDGSATVLENWIGFIDQSYFGIGSSLHSIQMNPGTMYRN